MQLNASSWLHTVVCVKGCTKLLLFRLICFCAEKTNEAEHTLYEIFPDFLGGFGWTVHHGDKAPDFNYCTFDSVLLIFLVCLFVCKWI